MEDVVVKVFPPPANEKCGRSKCPAHATDTVLIKNVGPFFFCHHHRLEVKEEKIEGTYPMTLPKQIANA